MQENHNIKTDNKTSEMVVQLRYLGTTLTNQNSIQEKINTRLNSGNVCYHSMKSLCLPVCYREIQRFRYTELQFRLFLYGC